MTIDPEKVRDNERRRRDRDRADPAKREARRLYLKGWRARNREKIREKSKRIYVKYRDVHLKKKRDYKKQPHVKQSVNDRNQRIANLLFVLRAEMPDLLKEFGL